MQSTSSVAQGSFLFLPDGFSLPKLKKSRKRKREESSGPKWEASFNKIWDQVNKEIKEINEKLFSKILLDLIEHLKKLHTNEKSSEGVIPCEILLTGTNLPDHKFLLSTLTQNLKEQITPHVASLWSWHCGNLKSTVQNFVSQIIPRCTAKRKNEDADELCDFDDEDISGDENNGINDSLNDSTCDRELNSNIKFHTSQYSLSTLSSWYNVDCKKRSNKKPIIIIIPDFESFLPTVLGDFIMLLSAYSSKVPFILVFGVATTPVAVYQSLSRGVLSQLVVQLFRSEPSTSVLNNVVENVFFSLSFPFRLGSKCMTFLTDIFLFHCFSVDGFVQGFKYCLIEHFYKRNHFALCCPLGAVDEEAKSLSDEELENIRKIPSFQKFVENSSKDVRKALLLDNDHTRVAVGKLMKDLLSSVGKFHVGIKILHILTSDLPRAPLGRNVREYYCRCVSSNVSESQEFKECMKLLELQSQNELLKKLENCLSVTSSTMVRDFIAEIQSEQLSTIAAKLDEFRGSFRDIGNSGGAEDEDTKKTTSGEGFETLRKNFLAYVEEDIVKGVLRPPIELPLYEVIYFDDLPSVRRRISGTPRGAIHLALNNPQRYLNCKCCSITNSDTIIPSMPDLSIAYKIHLECNKIINMYDWLQSFAAAIKQGDCETDGAVDQKIQARFTRAVSELQFLGFIKPSRAKTDHVSRLTWGNS